MGSFSETLHDLETAVERPEIHISRLNKLKFLFGAVVLAESVVSANPTAAMAASIPILEAGNEIIHQGHDANREIDARNEFLKHGVIFDDNDFY